MAIARASVADIRPDSLVGRATCLATYTGFTVQIVQSLDLQAASPVGVDMQQAAVLFSGYEADKTKP